MHLSHLITLVTTLLVLFLGNADLVEGKKRPRGSMSSLSPSVSFPYILANDESTLLAFQGMYREVSVWEFLYGYGE